MGSQALQNNIDGFHNTAIGYCALNANLHGQNNTAIGRSALSNNLGSDNIAIGKEAGTVSYWTSLQGSNNIFIGSPAENDDESNHIRIGNSNHQGYTYIKGIFGAIVTDSPNTTPVYIDSYGHLGTNISSRRYKEDIEDMAEASSALMRLRPVTFRYKPGKSNEFRPLQFGLIAEEVAEVYPNLVGYDSKTGLPQSVHYHLINVMLLNEVQKQHKEISALKEQKNMHLSALKEENRELSARLSRLETQLSKMTTRAESKVRDNGRLEKVDALLEK